MSFSEESDDKVEVLRVTEAPMLVIYNRVPKCASMSTVVLFNSLNTQLRRFDQYMSSNYTKPHLRTAGQADLAKNLSDIAAMSEVPVLYDRHVYFINFATHGFPQPVYINLIRDPIERFASLYYYIRTRPQSNLTPEERNMTLEECVATTCRDYDHASFLAYFCGTEPECSQDGPAMLELSKRNVEKYYLLVGLQEQLSDYYWALEKLLPSYFDGLHELWQKSDDSDNVNVATRKRVFSNETMKAMKASFHMEYEFYGFVQQRFRAVHKAIKDRTLTYYTYDVTGSHAFQTKAYKKSKQHVVDKYGRVGEYQCDTCIFMTNGV